MTEASPDGDPSLQLRQWLNENLKDVGQGGVVRYPPLAVVDALVALGPSEYDIGWSEFSYDGRSEVTTWSCTLATEEHLVEVTAEAQRRGDNAWTGDNRTAVDYANPPKVSVEVSRLDAVEALTLLTEGARDVAAYPLPGRQAWEFTFANGDTRDYVLDSREPKSADAIAALCRRLAANV